MKAMAIDSTMKILMMVVVSVVALAFLTKAFNIDVFGLINSILGGIGEPQSGKAVHIKLRDDKGKIELWEFHLTNLDPDGKELSSRYKAMVPVAKSKSFPADIFFFPVVYDLPKDQCVVYLTEASGDNFNLKPDLGMTYYVKIGSKIQQGQKNVISGLEKTGEGCINVGVVNEEGKCDAGIMCKDRSGNEQLCAGEFHYTICAKNKLYEDKVPKDMTNPCMGTDKISSLQFQSRLFNEDPQFCHDAPCCKEQPSACELLSRNPNNPKEFQYTVRYGIVCDRLNPDTTKPAQWVPCTKKSDQFKTVSGYTCIWNDKTGGIWQ